MGSAVKMIISALTGQLVPRMLDSMKRDKILGRDYQYHVRTLERNVSIIEGYRDVFILEDKNIRNWYMDLQDVMYAAIDTLDLYATVIERNRMDTPVDRLKNILYTISIHQVETESSLPLARTIELINQRIAGLLTEGRTHGYQEILKSEVTKYPELRPRPTSRPFDDHPIVGRDRTKSDIITWLKAGHTGGSPMRLQILPIVGMGGIGKTTLAQSIFASEKQSFQIWGWVHCPSKTINVESLLGDILLEFGDSAQNSNLGKLTASLAQKVKDTKFLLILDDAWSKEKQRWAELLSPLKGGGIGSKLIITTRDMEVVKNIEACHRGGVEPAVKLEGLEDELLWEILKNHAFGGYEPDVPGYAERIGRQIVPRLKGLPLAAKAIGSLLGADPTEKHWKRIQDSDLWGALKSDNDVNLVPALIISTLHLPPEAKPCFAYCSLFPRHRKPTVREMLYQWLALDYLQVQDNGSVEDAGETMVNYLESMSLVRTVANHWQSIYRPPESEHDILDMHDLIYDTSRASGRDDHFQISDDGDLDNLPVERLRHLYIDTNEDKLSDKSMEKLTNCKKLRTLIFMCNIGSKRRNVGRVLRLWFGQLKSLRVLTLEWFIIHELPEEIGQLKHLRYLDLSQNYIKRLPATMAELHHLQVLILHYPGEAGDSWEEMEVLGKLSKLRYLAISNYDLETLPESITSLSDLRVLSLSLCSKLKELPNGICNLKRLECLELYLVGIRKLPEGLSSLSCLRVLFLNCKELTTLPCNLTDLGSLSRLYLPNDLLHSISGVGKLTSLQNLQEFLVQEEEGHKIEGLANLNMLCHELKIRNLELVKSKAEAQGSKLEQKLKLEKLELHWKPDYGGTRDIVIEEAIIEGLKPSRDIKGLAIQNYMGKKLPPWLTSQHLRFLKSLCLSGLLNLGEIGGLGYAPTESNKEKRVKRARIHEDHSQIFPFVEELELSNLPNLDSWRADNCHGRFFPRLRKITMSNCPMLKCMPALPLSLENMVLNDVGLSELPPLQRQSGPVVFSSPSRPSSSSAQVPSLAYVELRHCPSLLSLQYGFLDRRLPNLRKLTIDNCENLQYALQNGFKDFVSLESLELMNCPGLPTLSMKSDAALPADLRDLNITNCTNLETESVQKSLQALTSLRKLTLHVCCRRMSKSFVKSVVPRHLKTIESCDIKFDDGFFIYVEINDRGLSVDNENDATNEEQREEQEATEEREEFFSSMLTIIFSDIPSSHVWDLELLGPHFGSDGRGTEIFLPYLDSLPADINKFSDLVNLTIRGFESFCPEDEGWVCVKPGEAFLGLKSVKHLHITHCEQLHSLPYSFFLETLEVRDCEGIQNISSLGSPMPHLRKLLISNCTNLENPPEKGFMMLQSLRCLILIDCPKLSKLSGTKLYSDLPPSLSKLTIMNCEELQFEHIEDYMSELTSLKKLTIMNCGGRISKSFVNRALHLLGPKSPLSCRLVSSEFAFQWRHVYYADGDGSYGYRSIVSWGCMSEEDRGDTCNCLEFLVEMLKVMSPYHIWELTISGIHELEVVEGKLKGTLLRLGLLELTIANCRNLHSFPTVDIAIMLPTFQKLCIKSCSKLPPLDQKQVRYAIEQESEYNGEETDKWLEEEQSKIRYIDWSYVPDWEL